MPNVIEVITREIVEGKGNIAAVGKELDTVADKSKGVNSGQKSLAAIFKSSWTEINSMLQVGAKAFRAVKFVADETVGTFVKYAEQVRNISLVTGESTEEVSRLLQVTDDYKINAEKLTLVMKKMASEGFAFTTDALADLSDEYLKLEPGVERQIFLTEKFGREGAAFAEIMLKGGDAIRSQADAVAENLILTQQAIDDAREYELAVDGLNDAMEGLKVQIGQGLVPPLTDLINVTTAATTDFEWLALLFRGDFKGASEAAANALEAVGFGAEDTSTAIDETALAAARMADSVQEAADALQRSQAEFGFVISFAKQFETNLDNITQAEGNLKEAQGELDALLAAGWGEASQYVIDARNKVEEFTGKLGEAEQASIDATNEMIAGFLQVQLTADGAFTEEDIQKVLEYRLAVGLLTQEAYNAALEALNFANNLAGIKDKDVNVNVYYRQHGNYEALATGGSVENGGMLFDGALAGGGSFGGNYLWDESAQSRPEVFVGGGGYVLTKQDAMNALGGGGGGAVIVNLTYAPMISLADEYEFQNKLLPFIRKGMREVGVNG